MKTHEVIDPSHPPIHTDYIYGGVDTGMDESINIIEVWDKKTGKLIERYIQRPNGKREDLDVHDTKINIIDLSPQK